ncbi:MAG: dehydrogenase, partial [Actinomycetota bacterium]|nr:dehydrogenase [Actinomycetota bacterium]
NLLWRPLASQPAHRPAVPGVWHVGASTHPGPRLGGASGALVADELLQPSVVERARGLVRR